MIFAAMLTGSVFLLMIPVDRVYLLRFLAAMLAGAVISTLLGLCIGIHSNNVAAANGMAVPIGLTVTLIPMLAQFNADIAKASRLLYSGQISMLLRNGSEWTFEAAGVILAYGAVLTAGLIGLFRKKGL